MTEATDTWYPVTPLHPSPMVQVRGIVEVNVSNMFEAHLIVSRGRQPHQNTWAEWIRGSPKKLPATAVVRYWQPQVPDKWGSSLPPPANVMPSGVMWSSGGSNQPVHDVPINLPSQDTARDAMPWWRDASLIKYEPLGSVTPRMAEGRVMRAVALCGHGQGLTIKQNSFSKILADVAAANNNEPYARSDYVPRLQALPQDGDDFLVAMAWFVAINPVDMRNSYQQRMATWAFNTAQRLLIWRSFDIPLSFDMIGARVGMSGEGARKAYKSAMSRVVRVANGMPAYAHLPDQCRHMDELRDRNRLAKRIA